MAKKIGLVLALDGEQKFTQAMKNAKSEVSLMRTELKNAESAFEGNANSMQALTTKQQALVRQQESYNRMLTTAKTGLDNAQKQYKKQVEALEDLKKKLKQAEDAQKEMEKAGDTSSDEYKKQVQEIEKLNQAIDKQTTNVLKASGRVTTWNENVAKTEGELNKCNSALNKNNDYLEEAKNASDGCAKSIDKFGKEVADTADELEEAGHGASTFGDVLKANLTSDVIISGVKAIGNVAKDAGKALLELGVDAAKYADDINTASTITGLSTDTIQAYKYAADLMDTSLETVTGALKKNLSSMKSAEKGTGKAAEAYKTLKVSVVDSNNNLRDSEDVFWDVIDALGGISDETKRDATAMDIFGKSAQELNPLIAAGSEGFAKFKEEAQNAGAILSSDTLNSLNDTNDKIDTLTQTADAFKKQIGADIAPVVGALAEGATSALNALNESIHPPKSELEKFVDDIKASNVEVQKILDNVEESMNGANAETSTLEAYKTTLLELNEQESLTEFNKFQIRDAVNQLSGSIPELAEAFDEETGKIKLTNEEMEKLFANAEAVAIQNAAIQAKAEAYDAMAQAAVNAAKADSAVAKAEEELQAAQEAENERYQKLVEEKGKDVAMMEFVATGADAEAKALKEAKDAQEEANNQYKEASDDLELINKALDDSIMKNGEVATATDTTTESVQNENDALVELSESAKATAESLGMTEEQLIANADAVGMTGEEYASAAEEIIANNERIKGAYDDMKKSVSDSITGTVDVFKKFEGGSEITADQIVENLDSQIAGIEQWKKNMETLGQQAGDGMSQELYDKLAEMGPESANLVQELVSTLESDEAKFQEISDKYAKALSLADNTDFIADATTAGKDMYDAFVTGFSDGSAEAEAEVKELAQKLADSLKEVDTAPAGTSLIEKFSTAIKNKESQVTSTAKSVVGSAIKEILGKGGEFQNAGSFNGSQYASGVLSESGNASNSGSAVAISARNGVASSNSGFQPLGVDAANGYANGISSGSNAAVSAAISMVTRAIQAIKNTQQSNSPSKVTKKLGGDNVAGYVKGIIENVSSAKKAGEKLATSAIEATEITLKKAKTKDWADKLSNKFGVSKTKKDGKKEKDKTTEEYNSDVMKAAETYFKNYNIMHNVSLNQEKTYWTKVRKMLDSGTQAYYDATAKLNDVNQKLIDARIQKRADDLNSWETYVDRSKLIGVMSEAQELAYWKKKLKQAKNGSEEYYKIYEYVQNAQNNVNQSKANKRAEKFSVQGDLLNQWKVYYKVSSKAEADYWDKARKKFKVGTKERIEADRMYFEAKSNYDEELKKAAEEYKEEESRILKEKKEEINELNNAYKDAVKSREQDIKSQMSLFESWDSSGYTSDVLMRNLKQQVEGLKVWRQQLSELSKKGVSAEFITELEEMGPDAAANIWTLNHMTATELDEYQKMWNEKNRQAHDQAVKENESFLSETNKKIQEAEEAAQTELGKIKDTYNQTIKDLSTGLANGLAELVKQSGKIGSDMVAEIIGGIQKSSGTIKSTLTSTASSATTSSTTTATTTSSKTKEDPLKSSIQKVINSGTKIDKSKSSTGSGALDKYVIKNYGRDLSKTQMKTMASTLGVKVSSSFTSADQDKILKELKKHGFARGSRRIPYDLFGLTQEGNMPEILTGNGGLVTYLPAGSGVIPNNLTENLFKWGESTPEEYLVSDAGMRALNNLMSEYGGATPTYNIDNSGFASMMQTMMAGMQGMVDAIASMQMVTQDGTLAGKLQPYISRDSAAISIRRNRGRL